MMAPGDGSIRSKIKHQTFMCSSCSSRTKAAVMMSGKDTQECRCGKLCRALGEERGGSGLGWGKEGVELTPVCLMAQPMGHGN